MNYVSLFMAMVLIWIAVIAGLYQRILKMPKWFANPPASFELIRRQSKKARAFWILLSFLFIISAVTAWFLNTQSEDVRKHILGGVICFGLSGLLSAIYFVKEVIAFTRIPMDASQTPGLLKRTSTWLRWTSIRNVLQVFAALFTTIAYRHA
ncbi:MAG: hypothetical protein ACJ749_17790 [Flavisolibacter sp.]